MGITRSCFGQPSPERLPKEQSEFKQSNSKGTGLTASIAEFMKVACLGIKNEAKDYLHVHENKQQPAASYEDKVVTLKDCLLSSPIHGSSTCTNGDDQIFVLRPSPFIRVYPSLAVDYYKYKDPGQRYSTERLLRDHEDDSSKSKSKSQSGKAKKRVSFKLPGEADIFVYNPPDYDPDEE